MINLTDLFKNLTEDQDNLCGDCDDADCGFNPNFKSNKKINKILGGKSMKTLRTNQVTEAMLRKPGTLFYVGEKSAKLVPGWRLSLGTYAVCLNDEEVPEGKWTKNLSGKLLSVIDFIVIAEDTDEYRTLVSELLCNAADVDDFDDAGFMYKIEDEVSFKTAVMAAKDGHAVYVLLNGVKVSFAIFIDTLRNIADASVPTATMIAFGKWFIE